MVSALGSVLCLVIYLAAPISDGAMLLLGAPLGFILYMMFSAMGPFMTELYPTEVRGAGQGFCYNSGRAIGALVSGAGRDSSATRLGLGSAILLFALIAYGLMLLALLMLPETKGRSVDAIEPGDMTSLAPSPAGRRGGPRPVAPYALRVLAERRIDGRAGRCTRPGQSTMRLFRATGAWMGNHRGARRLIVARLGTTSFAEVPCLRKS